jgi:hypothetical protein
MLLMMLDIHYRLQLLFKVPGVAFLAFKSNESLIWTIWWRVTGMSRIPPTFLRPQPTGTLHRQNRPFIENALQIGVFETLSSSRFLDSIK